MKRCRKCAIEYADDIMYCPSCGTKLESDSTMQKPKVVALGLVVVAAFILLGFIRSDHKKLADQQSARIAAREQKEWEEYLNTPTTSDVRIDSGWRCYIDGNYIYVEGTVTNKSSKDISYYEIKAEYCDSYGNVVTTDWTNGTRLGPGETQDFSIMHKKNSQIRDVKMSVQEVR